MCDSHSSPKLSIDTGGKEHLMVNEYASDVMEYLKSREKLNGICIDPNYMSMHNEISIKHRTIVVDWLVAVCAQFDLPSDSLFLAVNLMDRFLSLRRCPKSKIQLIGTTCLMLATKLTDPYYPLPLDFLHVSGYAFSLRELLKAEEIVFEALGYNLTRPTTFNFVSYYCHVSRCTDKRIGIFAEYLATLSLLDYSLLKYMPSEIAASSVHLALSWLGDEEPWNSSPDPSIGIACIEDFKNCVSSFGHPNTPYPEIYKMFASKKEPVVHLPLQ